jgi:hypothetical protein
VTASRPFSSEIDREVKNVSVYKRGDVWWYKFNFANRTIRESSKSASVTVAREAEKKRRRELEEGYNDLADSRRERVQTVQSIGTAYLADYQLKHRAVTFAQYAVGHVTRHLGSKMSVDIADTTIRQYQLLVCGKRRRQNRSMRKWGFS